MADAAAGAPLRRVDLREPQGAFVYRETLRPLLPPGPDLYARTCRIGEQLIAEQGYAFGGVVRDEQGFALTPAWLDAAGYGELRGEGGRIAASGSLSHTMFRRPAALDLGARDGSNVFGWGIEDRDDRPEGLTWPPKHLFLGARSEQYLEMVEVGPSVMSFDVSP